MYTGNTSTNSTDYPTGAYNNVTSDSIESDVDTDIELQDDSIKAAFISIACLSLFSSITALVVMQETKETPYTAKVLSTGLLTFDVLYIVSSTAKKFIINTAVNVNLQAMVTIWQQLAMVTVGMMAVERFILIIKPMFYLNNFSERKFNRLVFTIWILDISLCLFVRYGVCYFHHRTAEVYTIPAVCNKVLSLFYAVLLFLVLSASLTCYCRIATCLRVQLGKKTTFLKQPEFTLQKLKTTSLSFAYLVVILVTSIAYAIIIALINTINLQFAPLRVAMEVVSLTNCVLDPFLYVLWFKESRFILLRKLSSLCTCLQPRVTEMSIDVYCIVVSERSMDKQPK